MSRFIAGEMERNCVPLGWVLTTLGEVAVPRRNSVSPRNFPALSFIGLEHVEAHTMKLLGSTSAAEMKSSALLFEPGDVMYGRLRPYLNKVLSLKYCGLCSPEFIVFPRSPHLDSNYLQYFLNSWDFVSFASHLNEGDRPRVSFEQVEGYPFPLPPLLEQRRIVAEIEKQLSRLDAAVAALKRAQANLRRYRASVLKAACEGRLVPQDPNDEPARMLLERASPAGRQGDGQSSLLSWRADEAAKLAPKTSSDLPSLPPGWCHTGLVPMLATRRKGMKTGPFGSLLKKHEHLPEGVPVLGIENIKPMRFLMGSKIHISAHKARELADYDVKPGDVLISRSGTVGEVCVAPEGLAECRFSTNVMRIVLAPGGMTPQYFALLFNGSPFVLSQVSDLCKGTTRAFLNQDILKSLVLPLPPLAEQRRIVAEVERRLSVVDELEAAVEANLKRAERLRQAILKRAFEGRLVQQDPNDEPAAALLERIRAQRENSSRDPKRARPGLRPARPVAQPR